MNSELEAIRDALDKTNGRDYDAARALADNYITDHPDEFETLREMTRDQCVGAVDVFRAAEMIDDQWRVETWLLHHWEPPIIGGEFQATVRILQNG